MLFMVIERFKDGDAISVYRRFQKQGRMMPEGLNYVDSWVEADLRRCFQLVECGELRLLQDWVARWQDIVEFEIVPVVTSAEASQTITPLL